MEDNSQYRELFFEETDEHLQKLNYYVLMLEENPGYPNVIQEIFRSAHTLKGMAATMGYTSMAQLTHKLEDVFTLLKNGELQASRQVIDLVFESLDALSEIVESLRNDEEGELDVSHLIEKGEALTRLAKGGAEVTAPEAVQPAVEAASGNGLDAVMKTLDASDLAVVESAAESGYAGYQIAVRIDEQSPMKNARVFLVMNKLQEAGEVLLTEPSPEVLETEDFGTVFKVLYLTRLSAAETEKLIMDTSEIAEVALLPAGSIPAAEAGQTETAGLTEAADPSAGKAAENQNSLTAKKAKPGQPGGHAGQSIRVDVQKLDSFMNLVSELVIYRTRLENINESFQSGELNEPLEQVSRITTELQDLVLKIRMQSLSVVTTRFPRLIRDLSAELNKEMELIIEGDETELDRTVISELGEPLIHILRNAADHGIETADRRRELGKNPKGTIKISIYQEGNRVILNIADDGKGLDPQVIRESAVKKGIAVEGLNDKEIQQLIFHPGFSTAKEVTDISGRGVGMDVVKQKITELGGTVDIISEVNKGTTFRLNLPLTLSIIEALLVTVGEEAFALPLGVIKKVLKADPKDIHLAHNREAIIYEDKAVPVVRLSRSLGITAHNEESPYLILVWIDNQYYALAVDSLIRQQEIVIKKLGSALAGMKKYLGATIMGDGSIILIMDISAVCRQSDEEEAAEEVKERAAMAHV